MPERELFVVCSNCGSEVSPYVTECPYCGNRLRKRAPDLKKQRTVEEREEKKAERRRQKLRSQYEGGGGAPGAWLQSPSRPVATVVLILVAVIASLLARSGIRELSPWMLENLIYYGDSPLALLSAPFIQTWFGYGFVSLAVFAMFGSGIERRYGPIAVVAVWLACGAAGMYIDGLLIGDATVSFGAYPCAAGALTAWTIVVVTREDLRDFDSMGLAAVAAVICALPIATDAASVWALIGGLVGGVICGAVLMRLPSRG